MVQAQKPSKSRKKNKKKAITEEDLKEYEDVFPQLLSSNSLVRLYKKPSRGRCLIAAQSVPEGTLLLREAPYMCIPNRQKKTDGMCEHCVNSITASGSQVIPCGDDCKLGAAYCSDSCREAHTDEHAIEHQFFDQMLKTCEEISADVMLLRLAYRGMRAQQSRGLNEEQENIGEEGSIKCIRPTKADIEALEAPEPQESDPWVKPCTEAFEILNPAIVEAGLLPNDDDLTKQCLQMCAVINSNSHGIIDVAHATNKVIGIGLFPHVAMANHGCYFNALHVSTGRLGVLEVRAARPIKKGEEVTISYCDFFSPKEIRKGELKRDRGFVCNCSACVNEAIDVDSNLEVRLTGIICDTCGSYLMPDVRAWSKRWESPDTNWTCSNNPKHSVDMIQYQSVESKVFDVLLQLKTGNLDAKARSAMLEKMLDSPEMAKLGPGHWMRFNLLVQSLQTLYVADDYVGCHKAADEIIKCMEAGGIPLSLELRNYYITRAGSLQNILKDKEHGMGRELYRKKMYEAYNGALEYTNRIVPKDHYVYTTLSHQVKNIKV
eukprot:Clim_evm62s153 gene=Clim_evmTU62s153